MIRTIEAEHLTASVAEAFQSISLCGKCSVASEGLIKTAAVQVS